ncbi:phosphate ABC transporter permease subunit PstC [Lactococcus termiticola]|uniref:Phosphate transport system permease protein n=1 Tax=Lactococcus termiticola TaxID=2169526 RepID=A0A2R5HKG7_9LACT|nr:phosphate ABC transporter permease subunit PstC [Lactococcus termiticola]GBG97051.1 phosphate ABC transporter permease protein [Lactococcus termiticola]
MENSKLRDKLLSSSKNSRLEKFGKTLTFLCIALIVFVVGLILVFVAEKGLSTFFVNGVNPLNFLFGTNWMPGSIGPDGKPAVGALPMFSGSLIVTILSALIATPFAIGAGIYMTEISPKYGSKILQPVIELLVGIPSVVYGFIGLTVIVPLIRGAFGGTGLGLLSGVFVLFVMILPTVTSMTVDALKAVPGHYREASLGLGATRWQTIWRVLLRAATPGILTAVIFGMARAFGEALAVQMVVGNAVTMPKNLISPASTLTSILTSGIPNATPGIQLNALWSLALLLLLMSLVFNLIMRAIAKKGSLK